MPLPWNRGDEETSPSTWVDLLPLSGHLAPDRSGADGSEAREPVLVAPHRDPGEDAVNHDMPPQFQRARTAPDAPGESGDGRTDDDGTRGPADRPDPPRHADATPSRAAVPDDAHPGGVTPDAAPPDAVDGAPGTAGDPGTVGDPGTAAGAVSDVDVQAPDAVDASRDGDDPPDDEEDAPLDSKGSTDAMTPNNQ